MLLDYVPEARSTWAPAVVILNDKYYMYYSLSTFGSQVSYIGRVEADSPLGPYTNSVEILRSRNLTAPMQLIRKYFLIKTKDYGWFTVLFCWNLYH